jgi:hypothetical protein
MRKSLRSNAVILFLLALAGIALCALPAGGGYWVALRQAQYAQFGGKPAAWIMVDGSLPGGEGGLWINASISKDRPFEKIFVADSPLAGASEYGAFAQALKEKFAQTPVGIEAEPAWEMRSASQRAAWVIPNGAWPAAFLGNESLPFGEDDLVVYFGTMKQVAIKNDGNVTESALPDWLGQKWSETRVDGVEASGGRLPNGCRIFMVPKLLDELGASRAADIVSRLAMADYGADSASVGWIGWQGREGGLVVLIGDRGGAYARITVQDGQGGIIRMWDRTIVAGEGEINGPKAIYQTEPENFQVSLRRNLSQSERLDLSAAVLDENGRELYRQPVGSGYVGENQAYIGSFKLQDCRGFGMRQVALLDQYGREFARAVVDCPNISITPIGASRQARKFYIEFDGKPIEGHDVRALWGGMQEFAQVQVMDGVVILPARGDGAGGEGAVFMIDGERFLVGTAAGAGETGPVLLGALAGLAVLALVMRMARQGKEYAITTPEPIIEKLAKFRIRKSGLAQTVKRANILKGKSAGTACPLPARADEIADALKSGMPGIAGARLERLSLARALDNLAEDGMIAKFGGYYLADGGGFGKEHARELALLCQARDRMIAKGANPKIRISKEGGCARITFPYGGRKWMVYDPKCGLEALMKAKGLGGLIFAAEGEIREFETKIGADERFARVRVMTRTGALRLAIGGPE